MQVYHLHSICHLIESKSANFVITKLKSFIKFATVFAYSFVYDSNVHVKNIWRNFWFGWRSLFCICSPNKVKKCVIRRFLLIQKANDWRFYLSKNFMHFSHSLCSFAFLYASLSVILLLNVCCTLLIVFSFYDVFGIYSTIFFAHIFMGPIQMHLKAYVFMLYVFLLYNGCCLLVSLAEHWLDKTDNWMSLLFIRNDFLCCFNFHSAQTHNVKSVLFPPQVA